MAQVNVIGRITADLELKTSEKSNPYVRFDIAENIGSRQTLHTQYFQVCAWGEDANRLMKAHAKKGSLIWVTGSLELEPYTKRDGISIDKRMKILLDNWGFVPVGRVGASKQEPTPPDPKIPPKQEYDGTVSGKVSKKYFADRFYGGAELMKPQPYVLNERRVA